MKFEQESNPSAAVAAPPFNKGGKGLAPELAETAAANVPLAKGGWPAGPGGFCERQRGNLSWPLTRMVRLNIPKKQGTDDAMNAPTNKSIFLPDEKENAGIAALCRGFLTMYGGKRDNLSEM